MISFRLIRFALALLGCAALCGCFPAGPGRSDEEREPHFQAGRARVNAMDYKGAILSFTRALEVNPRSASAHLELGILYAQREFDPASAIYHYEQYLRLRPAAGNAETIRQHIFGLKQDLAKGVLPLPPMSAVQRELERKIDQLAEENRRLRDEVEKWRAYHASRSVTAVEPMGATSSGGRAAIPGDSGTPSVSESTVPPSPIPSPRPTGGVTMRTHKVQSGETLAAIARKYGVRLEALVAANPGVNPRRMHVGQLVNVPSA